VPTLVLEDGTAIGEVPAIMRYLDEGLSRKSPCWGATPKEQGPDRDVGSGAPSSKASRR